MPDISVGVKIAANGRMVLPIAVRRALGLTGEGKVTVNIEDGKVTLTSVADDVRWIQEQYRKMAKRHGTVDEFLEERREENRRREAFLDSMGNS